MTALYWLAGALVLDIIYLAINIYRCKGHLSRNSIVEKTLIIILVPYIGVLFFAFSGVFYYAISKVQKRKYTVQDMGEISPKQKQDAYVENDAVLDQVPLEETLVLAGKKQRRMILLQQLKKDNADTRVYLLRQALKDEDSEVSHYAATALSEAVDKYKQKEQTLWEECTTVRGAQREKAMKDYLNHGSLLGKEALFCGEEQNHYESKIIRVAKQLVREFSESITGEQLAAVIYILMRRKDTAQCEQWVKFALHYKEDVDIYMAGLSYYLWVQDTESFFTLLRRVQSSTVVPDNRLQEIVQFYSMQSRQYSGS